MLMQLDLFGLPPAPARRRDHRPRQRCAGLVTVNERGRRIGEDHHNAVLSNADVELLLDLREREDWSYGRLARKFEVAKSTVADVVKGRRRSQTVAGHRVVCATQAANGSM